jgi:hypothetical protein
MATFNFSQTKTVSYTVVSDGSMRTNSDGSVTVPVSIVASDGATVTGDLILQPDGVTWHDAKGNPIVSPPPALVALATATTNYLAKQAACIAAPGVQALLQSLVP